MAFPNPFTLVSFVAAALAVLLGAYAWGYRDTPCGAPLAALSLGIAVWTASYGIRVASTDLAGYVLWMNVEWIGILLASVAWLRFALEYTGADRWARHRTLAASGAPALLLLALVWLNPNELFRSAASGTLRTVGGLVLYRFDHGPLYWLAFGYASLLLFAGTALLIQSVVAAPRSARRRNVVLIVAAVIPWLAAALDVTGYGPAAGLNLAPFALTLSCLALGWIVFAGHLFDALPLTPIVNHGVVFSELADGIIVLDAEDRVVECNPTAHGLLPDGSIRGRPVGTILPGLAAVLESDQADTISENVVLDADAQARYFEVRTTPIQRGENRPIGRLVTLRDIDDRILREQRLDVLNRILRHNVRNQMTVILGHNRNVIEELSDEVLIEQAETVNRAGQRLLDWAERAQQVERTVGREATEANRIDLVGDAAAVGERLGATYPTASISTHADGPAWIVADRSISEAIEELVTNAITHNDRPRATIRIDVESDGETVELRVRDDGPGIPLSERHALARGKETPLDHASGLGLWLVNWLVRLSGGVIEFEENDPRGSVVTLRFPAAPPEEPDAR